MSTQALCIVAGLSLATPLAAQDIIAIGDSIMDWNEENSIPAQLAQSLGVAIDDRSLAGSQISTGFLGRLQGFDIRAQLGDDRPDILVMTGGGNDLGDGCGCSIGCEAELEKLLTDNGQGELGDFLRSVTSGGTRVYYLGYADPPTGGNEFSGCIPHFRSLASRLTTVPGVTYVSVQSVIDPADISFYDADRVHPSIIGSTAMATLLAEAIRAD